MVMKNTLIQLNIRSNKDNLKDKKMKKSELRKLISDYSLLKIKSKKHDVTDKLKQIEHRYFHETGRNIIDDMS